MEVRDHFTTVSAYIRTYHNDLQDFLSRETPAAVHAEMRGRGFAEVEAKAAWEDVLRRGYERRVHALAAADRDDWKLAAQLAYRRDPPSPHPGPEH